MTSAERLDMASDPRSFRLLPVGQLVVDERKQRAVNPEKIAKIANEFDWAKFEALTVCERGKASETIKGMGDYLRRLDQVLMDKAARDRAIVDSSRRDDVRPLYLAVSNER